MDGSEPIAEVTASSTPAQPDGRRPPRTDEQRARAAELMRARRAEKRAKEAKLLDQSPTAVKPEAAPAALVPAQPAQPEQKRVWPKLEEMTAAAGEVRTGLAGLRSFIKAAGVKDVMKPEEQEQADALASMALAPWACTVAKDPNESWLLRNVITPDVLAVVGIGCLAWPYVGPSVVAGVKWVVEEVKKGRASGAP